MSALTGFLSASAQGGAAVPAVASSLSSYAVDNWPGHASAAASGLFGARTSALPVTPGNIRALTAWKAGSYVNDFYGRVHLIPSSIALGNLVTAQVRQIKVWNAYLETAQTLTSVVEANASGIDNTPPAALPITFQPLQLKQWDVSVSPAGDPVINATITWNFTGLAGQSVTITGNRVTAWTLPPYWNNPVVERLEFKTDVLMSITRTEQVRALRQTPRRTWEFDCAADGVNRQWLEACLYEWTSRSWVVPVWPDVVWLSAPASGSRIDCDTANRDFAVGQLVMAFRDPLHYELAEVQAIDAGGLDLVRPLADTWGVGCRVYPMRNALLNSASLTHQADETTVVQASFTNYDSAWASDDGGVAYRALPVLELRPTSQPDPGAGYERASVTMDNMTGIPEQTEYVDMGFPSRQYRWWMLGADQRAAWRSLMYYLRGRYQLIWVPTFMRDVTLATDVADNAPALTIAWCGYTRFLAGRQHRRDLRIELLGGTVLYRRITAWAEVDADTESLTLDSPIVSGFMRSQVRAISFMALCKLDSDTAEISHNNTLEGTAQAVGNFKAVNDDL